MTNVEKKKIIVSCIEKKKIVVSCIGADYLMFWVKAQDVNLSTLYYNIYIYILLQEK